MKPILQILPLTILMVGVVWVIWRGMRKDVHDRDTGGSDIADGD